MKRKFLLIVTLLITFMCVACKQDNNIYIDIFSRPVVEKPAEGRKNWNDVSSFICYYGDFDYEVQSKFDVVIMHSSILYNPGHSVEEGFDFEAYKEQAKNEVAKLQAAGCYVVSYITIGEDDTLTVADGLGEGGYASYYIYENGVPKQNANWGSWFVDAGNPVWQAKILDEASQILDFGVDGLFLDTLDTVDIANNTLSGMADLVKKLDEAFPNAKLVANRGFTVLPYISQHIDGLMFESFNTTVSDFETGVFRDLDQEERDWNELVACNTINAVRRYDYFPVFVLDYVNLEDYDYMTQYYYNRSWQYDFIPYSTYDLSLGTPTYPLDYDGNFLVPTSNRGELALSKLASSELEGYNGDSSASNLAYKENGATVKVSSTFQGYKTTALNDGWFATPENHVQSNWAKESWASTDNKNIDHWIEFDFGENKEVSQVVVHWANDNDTYYSPKKAIIEANIGGEWVEVAIITNDPLEEGGDFKAFEETWVFTFDTVTTNKIRVVQPKGCGAHDNFNIAIRAGVMWVSEVEIYKEAKYNE